MALITGLERVTKERQSIHKPTRCLASDFIASDGKRYLQLDTVGSDERAFPDKVSQSLQFDERGAEALLTLIAQTFPGVK